MAGELEDKYSRFKRDTNIDLLAEIAAGGSGGTIDHGSLTGLADDDHTQYHNDARGDARYYTKAQVDTSLSGKSNTGHTHDDRYYTETETNNLLNNKTNLSDTPRYLVFNTTWPARPADSRMTFYIGGNSATNAPADAVAGDVWIPAT